METLLTSIALYASSIRYIHLMLLAISGKGERVPKSLLSDQFFSSKLHLVFFYKLPTFDPRPKNCLSFSKKSPQKIV